MNLFIVFEQLSFLGYISVVEQLVMPLNQFQLVYQVLQHLHHYTSSSLEPYRFVCRDKGLNRVLETFDWLAVKGRSQGFLMLFNGQVGVFYNPLAELI